MGGSRLVLCTYIATTTVFSKLGGQVLSGKRSYGHGANQFLLSCRRDNLEGWRLHSPGPILHSHSHLFGMPGPEVPVSH